MPRASCSAAFPLHPAGKASFRRAVPTTCSTSAGTASTSTTSMSGASNGELRARRTDSRPPEPHRQESRRATIQTATGAVSSRARLPGWRDSRTGGRTEALIDRARSGALGLPAKGSRARRER